MDTPTQSNPWVFTDETVKILRLKAQCIIGVWSRERVVPQPVLVTLRARLDFGVAANTDNIHQALDYDQMAQAIRVFLAQHRFHLLETLARQLAQHLAQTFDLAHLELEIQKPEALKDCEAAAVSLTLTRKEAT